MPRRYCKVEPSPTQCQTCTNAQYEYCDDVSCDMCSYKQRIYEILGFAVGTFGTGYAFLLREGKIYKVSIDRLFDVNEEVEF